MIKYKYIKKKHLSFILKIILKLLYLNKLMEDLLTLIIILFSISYLFETCYCYL